MAKIISTSKFERMLVTANARLEKTKEKVEMYKARLENQVSKLSKITPDFADYSNSWDFMKKYGEKAGNLLYSYQSNLDRINELQKDIAYEQRNIDNLKAQIQRINDENSSLLDSTNIIVNKFEEVLATYKVEYMNAAIANCKKHYEYVHANLDKWKAIISKAKSELPWYYTSDNFKYYSRGYLKYENGIQYYRWGHGDNEWKEVTEDMQELYLSYLRTKQSLKSDAVTYNNLNDYLTKKKNDLIDDWNAKILTVADKCKKFGLNIDKIKINVDMKPITAGNIDMWITDGSDRRIYARMIIAAEYSDKVSAHIRFIVTEKRM